MGGAYPLRPGGRAGRRRLTRCCGCLSCCSLEQILEEKEKNINYLKRFYMAQLNQ